LNIGGIDSMQNETITLRPALAEFATGMEQLLRKNDAKGGWENETLLYLTSRFNNKAKSAMDAVDYVRHYSESNVSIDVAIEDVTHAANYLMMIADNLRRMKQEGSDDGDDRQVSEEAN
jgi:hypothetical protein